MDAFNYRHQQLFVEAVAVEAIVQQYGSPCYIYSKVALEKNWHAFNQAFGTHPHLICYAVKANANIAILNLLARLGSGFDIVSKGELERVIIAGGEPKKIVFSGVGKRKDEIIAALKVGIHCFNIEIVAELDRINQLAGELGVIAPVSFRVNPNVDAKTHPYISTGLKENKFGIDSQTAIEQYLRAAKMSHIKIVGIDCHIGSQLTEIDPFIAALGKILEIVTILKQHGIQLEHLDMGGGLGICYQQETPPDPMTYIKALLKRLGEQPYEILLEPGRAIIGNAGILVTQVDYLKKTPNKNFAIVDAAMNDLIRPALYDAWQNISAVNQQTEAKTVVWDIVGPICETGDFLGKNRSLKLTEGDLLAIHASGAYGFCMSSNYNSRPRVAEIMVAGQTIHLIKERESFSSLWATEKMLYQP
jgi:diaminopimelate decarboxylase